MLASDDCYEDDFESGDDLTNSVTTLNANYKNNSTGHEGGNTKEAERSMTAAVGGTFSESGSTSAANLDLDTSKRDCSSRDSSLSDINWTSSRLHEPSPSGGGLKKAPVTTPLDVDAESVSLHSSLSSVSSTSQDWAMRKNPQVTPFIANSANHLLNRSGDEEEGGVRLQEKKDVTSSNTREARTNNTTHGIEYNNKSYGAARETSNAGFTHQNARGNPSVIDGVGSSSIPQKGQRSVFPRNASTDPASEARDGIMHQSNVTTVWMLEKEEPQLESFVFPNRHGSVSDVSADEGADLPMEGTVQDFESASECSSREVLPQKQQPVRQEERQRKVETNETNSSASSSLSSDAQPSAGALRQAHPTGQGAVKGIITSTLHIVPPAQRTNQLESSARLETSLVSSSRRSSVTIISPSSESINASTAAAAITSGAPSKGTVARSGQQMQADKNSNTPLPFPSPIEEKKAIKSHTTPNTVDTLSKPDSPIVSTIWKKGKLPIDSEHQQNSQKLPMPLPTSLKSDAIENFRRQIASFDDQRVDSSDDSEDSPNIETKLMQNLRSLKDQIAHLNTQIEAKEKEIANISRTQSAGITSERGEFGRNYMGEQLSVRSGGVHNRKRTMNNKNKKAVPFMVRLERLRLINKDLEEKFSQCENEITVESLIEGVNKRLERARERLKEAQIVKRGLESCDKRVEHMIEALHRRLPPSEEIKNRQVNENIYRHASLERKIEHLKDSIKLRQTSRQAMLAKCQELEVELKKKNYAIGVVRGDVLQLRNTFEKNKRKIEQLHAAIAIYRHAMCSEPHDSASRRTTSSHSQPSTVPSRRITRGKEEAEDKALNIRYDSAKQRRQELEEEVQTLKSRLQHRCMQIETNLAYDMRAHCTSSSRTPRSIRKVGSRRSEDRQSPSQGRQYSDNSSNHNSSCNNTNNDWNLHRRSNNPLPPPERALSNPASRETGKFTPSTKGNSVTRGQNSDLNSISNKSKAAAAMPYDENSKSDSGLTRFNAGSTLPLHTSPNEANEVSITPRNVSAVRSVQPCVGLPVEEEGITDEMPSEESPQRAKQSSVKRDALPPQQRKMGAARESTQHPRERGRSDSEKNADVRANSTRQDGLVQGKYMEKRNKVEEVDDDLECEVGVEEITESSGRTTPLWLRDS
ncbi:unnamed protein product [Phytomonas sp. EM1]|nr:unnamed protein product [Phytomonas sp. EM1]|eukprot:CCW64702.1 unnamed protein product [Phytomonas sp. isolate EM1]